MKENLTKANQKRAGDFSLARFFCKKTERRKNKERKTKKNKEEKPKNKKNMIQAEEKRKKTCDIKKIILHLQRELCYIRKIYATFAEELFT